ncbi:MAG TPA: ATP-binding cassette domain-containing protein [Myxococcales bacterium]
MAIVETRKIVKRFGDSTAVDGVDLATTEGEFLVLLGPSGCGKTTLLRMVAGLELQTSGDVLIGGRVVNDIPPRARKIAMVFQSYALYPHMTVAKNIAFPLKAQGVDKKLIPERIQRAASMFGIERLLDRKPRQLSGGERQRVALARAVVREPAVFLLDEPLSNLDAKLRTTARDELQQFQRRLGTTTIYVTHDQVEAMGLGDRIAVMNQGRVRQLGKPQEVYSEPADTFVAGFLGSPPMNFFERDEVISGFRPEHFLPKGAQEGGDPLMTLSFHVHRVENLGASRLLYGNLRDLFPQQKVIASLPSTMHIHVQAGAAYEFAVKEKDLKYFDRSTGVRTGRKPFWENR